MSQALDRDHGFVLGASTKLPEPLSRLLARPDLRIAPHERSISFAAELAGPFVVDATGHVRLGPLCLARGERGPSLLRHALELALLLPRLPHAPVLAGLAAARTAGLFATIHGADGEDWYAEMAAPAMPTPARLANIWARLGKLQRGCDTAADAVTPNAATLAALADAWCLLGPTEAMLQTGGDQRLRVDPATGLNFYGCSHRPRPWAVTFASSTASSSSERGFAEAEAARQRVTLAALAGQAVASLAEEAASVQAGIIQGLRLPRGTQVVLAASGTDCELMTLAIAAGDGPVTNLLVAPEETGSGVPLAATGCHFATDTAMGATVTKGERIAGYPADIQLARVAARGLEGALRPIATIDTDCATAAAAAVATGRRVILHLLDISKTGYLAPSVAGTAALAARHPAAIRVVVDACQDRLTASRLAAYLGRGWLVQITGSKFLTGPPFAGAILVPAGWALPETLPLGLADYSSAPEWPPRAAPALPATANYGLLLRWHAALAELAAFRAVPPARKRAILTRFCARVRQGIEASPDFALLEVAPPPRPDDGWDSLQTIIGFIVRPADPLDAADARLVYNWLNADIRPGLPSVLTAEQERLACLRCHIGQPVPLRHAGHDVGVLRISAGARLVSGEPSHHDLDEDARLLREINDALSVLAKISLILANWITLRAVNPQPSF